jgi:stage III sporulation protein AE
MLKKILILSFILISCFTMKAYAADEGQILDMSEIENSANAIQQENDYMPDLSFSNLVNTYKSSGKLSYTIKDFSQNILKFLFKEIIGNSKLLVELLFIGIMCSILQNIQNSFDSHGVSKIAYYVCFLLMITIIIKSFTLTMNVAKGAIDSMVQFTNALMPALLTLLAAVGGFTSAAMLDPVLVFVIKIISDIIRDFIIPLTMLVVVLNIVDSMSENIKVTRLAELIKQINYWTLGIIMTIFVGFITVRSSASSTIDQVTLKTTKYALDNFVPVVGKCMSDAISTVAGYTAIFKDAVSVAGLFILLIISIYPLLKILIIALIYKFVGAVMEPVVDKKVVDCLGAVGNSLVIMFAAVLSAAVMLFIMITMVAQTGKLVMMVR